MGKSHNAPCRTPLPQLNERPSLNLLTTLRTMLCSIALIQGITTVIIIVGTVLPAKSDSDVLFCLQSCQGLGIDRSLGYKSYSQDRINTQVIY